MSAYLNQYKQEYVDLLLNISRHGGDYWSDWIRFLLNAIHTQRWMPFGGASSL
ncbi:MAG: hypothetical protein R3B90_02150 [Planctomycetaceae bacterium]